MADKFFPLNERTSIGSDAQGKSIYPNTDFVRQWDLLWARVGKYEAPSNTELDAAGQSALAAANAAQADADSAGNAASTAQSSAASAQDDATTALSQIATFSAIPFVTTSPEATLTGESVLTQGENIEITVAPGLVTIALAADPDLKDSGGNSVVTVAYSGTDSELGFFGETPIARPTTAHAPGAFVANVGTPVMDVSTFEGYTIGQIARALKDLGLLT